MSNTDLIIFGGQSNMQGQTEALSECEEVAGAQEYKFLEDALVPLRNPVGENILYDGQKGDPVVKGHDSQKWLSRHALGGACYGHTNMVPSFCRAYLKDADAQVVAVHAAKGSTEIKDWLPQTDGYNMLVKKARAAIEKVKAQGMLGHIYFVWLQGESDAIFRNSKAHYMEQMETLAQALRNDLNIEAFGVIRVGAFTNDARDEEIISAQSEICKANSFFVMLTEIAVELNKNPVMMNPEVGGHYSAKGQETLGEVAGAALARYRREGKC